MTRAVLFLATAMVAASLGVVAQQNPAGAQNSAPQNNGDNTAQRTVTISGCLSSSGVGVYTLSDAQGANYTLAGNTDSLQNYKGQEIEVTGQQTFASGNLPSASSSTTNSTPTIQVGKSKFVADHCQSGRGSQSTPSKPGSTASAGGMLNGDAHIDNVAQIQGASDLNNGQLPQTSTILPLLGLIGLGSLVAGFFARR